VLGRDFSYALLASIAAVVDRGERGGGGDPALQTALSERGASDRGLQSALDRLVDADLLFVEGAPPPTSR